MISISSAELNGWLGAVLWPLTRVLATLSTAPMLGSQKIPAPIKIGLALLLTVAIVPTLDPAPQIDPASGAGLLVLVNQVLIGVAMGFAMQLVFTAVEMAGDLAGLQMGLGFAMFYDPQQQGQSALIGQFLSLLATLVFLSLNGHLLIVSALVESFRTLPISSTALSAFGWNAIAAFGARIFVTALFMSLPIIVTLLIVNLALGVLTRAAPQLNIFAIGFPITLTVGLVLLLVALPHLVPQFERLFQDGLATMAQVATFARPR